jgi:hypothetical protein
MSELTLVGLHDDGEHVVLEGADGQQFRVRIDEALRAAVRRDRPQMEQARAELAGMLPPREIQARIRAGGSAQEIADSSGMPLEIIRRYEGPVLAEREHVALRARDTHIGHDPGSPVLGDLVTDRLATRQVPPGTVVWDAYRTSGSSWTVELQFRANDAPRSARWTFDTADRRLHALDDEARWLSETEFADEPIRRHLTAVRDAVFDVEIDAALRPLLASVDLPLDAPSVADPQHETHVLLDDLSDRRGVRQAIDVDGEDYAGFGPQHAFDFEHPGLTGQVPGAHPAASRPSEAVDAQVLRMPAARDTPRGHDGGGGAPPEVPAAPATRAKVPENREPGEPERPAPRRHRRGRASVPSWDEIVFGAKPE